MRIACVIACVRACVCGGGSGGVVRAVLFEGLCFFGAVLAPKYNLNQFGAVFSILAPCLLAPFGAKIELEATFGAVWRQS